MNQKLSCVIFDMDGVISDTQKYHALAESKVLETYDISMNPDDITARFAGVSDDEMFEIIFNEHDIDMPSAADLIHQKWHMMTALVDNVEPIEGVVELIQSLRNAGCVLAVASSSPIEFIEKVLNSLKLKDYFYTYVSADEVDNGKPAPDIFLKAAKQCTTEPEKCLVIEDGESGIKGANKAGMTTVSFGIENSESDIKVVSMRDVIPQLEAAGYSLSVN